jgi:hypothetical protein
MTNKQKEILSYYVDLYIRGESPVSAAVPENVDGLLTKPDKPTAELLFQILKADVEKLLQVGETAAARKLLIDFQNREEKQAYMKPKMAFKRDKASGSIFLGAHCLYGAFRDASKFIQDKTFYVKGKKGYTTYPSAKHLRKFMNIRPPHMIFMRDGKPITEPDRVEDQQPVGPEVKGFSSYEIVDLPWSIHARIQIAPPGPFQEFLSDPARVEASILQASNHGLGARRAAGYGMWRAERIEFVGIDYTSTVGQNKAA